MLYERIIAQRKIWSDGFNLGFNWFSESVRNYRIDISEQFDLMKMSIDRLWCTFYHHCAFYFETIDNWNRTGLFVEFSSFSSQSSKL